MWARPYAPGKQRHNTRQMLRAEALTKTSNASGPRQPARDPGAAPWPCESSPARVITRQAVQPCDPFPGQTQTAASGGGAHKVARGVPGRRRREQCRSSPALPPLITDPGRPRETAAGSGPPGSSRLPVQTQSRQAPRARSTCVSRYRRVRRPARANPAPRTEREPVPY